MDQQHRTTLCAVEDACSSYKLASFMDSGFSVDAALEMVKTGAISRNLTDATQGRLGLGGFSCVKSVWDVVLSRVFNFRFSDYFLRLADAARTISDGEQK